MDFEDFWKLLKKHKIALGAYGLACFLLGGLIF